MQVLSKDANDKYTYKVKLGENCCINGHFTDQNDADISLTGKTMTCKVYENLTDTSEVASATVVLLNQTLYTGEFIANITPTSINTCGRGSFIIRITETHDTAQINIDELRLIIE